MQIIFDGHELRKIMRSCIIRYQKYSFATAWASAGTDVFDELFKYRDRIEHAVVGTHFYQTDPFFVESFVDYPTVRFRFQPSGVFHPKMYIFEDERNNWAVLIGSANLTRAALESNQECMVLISSEEEPGCISTFNDSKNLIKTWWNAAKICTPEDAAVYRDFWQQRKKERNILSGEYGASLAKKTPMETALMQMTWDHFYKEVIANDPQGTAGRCAVLNDAQNDFSQKSYKDMDEELRLSMAGCNRSAFRGQDWRWFGSIPQGKFPTIVRSNNIHLSNALDNIPLHGPVEKIHYMAYINEFLKAFPAGGDGLAVVTRLITIKRPDFFVCLNDKNRKALCRDFGIDDLQPHKKEYERYWDDIVERITTSIWWKKPEPVEDGLEKSVWLGRAAMIDAIFYDQSTPV